MAPLGARAHWINTHLSIIIVIILIALIAITKHLPVDAIAIKVYISSINSIIVASNCHNINISNRNN